jgi:erythromycin esterase-like protein
MVDALSFATSEVHLHSITGAPNDYDRLFDLVGDRKMVLIGEASHGTHDFYAERARITRHLLRSADSMEWRWTGLTPTG